MRSMKDSAIHNVGLHVHINSKNSSYPNSYAKNCWMHCRIFFGAVHYDKVRHAPKVGDRV